MNRRILALFVSLAVFSPAFALAHEDDAVAQAQEKPVPARKQVVEEKKALKADISQKRETLKTEIKQKQEALKTDVKQKREAIKAESKTLAPEMLKEKRTVLREDIKKERTELKEQIKQKRDTFKEGAKERVEALKNKLSEEKAKRVEVFFGTMVRKFEAAINRLRNLADRIDARLDKFEDVEKDVSASKTALDNARMVIDEAESSLDRAKEEFKAMAQNEKPDEYFKKVKEVVAIVSTKTKDAHRALIDVINSTKGISQQ